MAIDSRIRFFRKLRGLTQKQLADSIGLYENGDIRISQYEKGSRIPSKELREKMAQAFSISPLALSDPDIDAPLSLMHLLFTLEDVYGLRVCKINDALCLKPDSRHSLKAQELSQLFLLWYLQASRFHSGEISKEQYDYWRYHFPEEAST